MVVEDDEVLRRIFVRSLEQAGLGVFPFADAASAQAALKSQNFACLVTDLSLPGGGVGSLIREFRALHNKPVLVCSGSLESEIAFECIEKDEYSFLPKPCSPTELNTQVLGLIQA